MLKIGWRFNILPISGSAFKERFSRPGTSDPKKEGVRLFRLQEGLVEHKFPMGSGDFSTIFELLLSDAGDIFREMSGLAHWTYLSEKFYRLKKYLFDKSTAYFYVITNAEKNKGGVEDYESKFSEYMDNLNRLIMETAEAGIGSAPKTVMMNALYVQRALAAWLDDSSSNNYGVLKYHIGQLEQVRFILKEIVEKKQRQKTAMKESDAKYTESIQLLVNRLFQQKKVNKQLLFLPSNYYSEGITVNRSVERAGIL